MNRRFLIHSHFLCIEVDYLSTYNFLLTQYGTYKCVMYVYVEYTSKVFFYVCTCFLYIYYFYCTVTSFNLGST